MSCVASGASVASTPSTLSAASKPKCSSIFRSICAGDRGTSISFFQVDTRTLVRCLSHVNDFISGSSFDCLRLHVQLLRRLLEILEQRRAEPAFHRGHGRRGAIPRPAVL